jgi:cytochrome P450
VRAAASLSDPVTCPGRARRSPHLWRDPDAFRPERFAEAHANADFAGAWAGYRPEAQGSSLYPNEVASDFAFIPFGGGMRKCVGDQFALTEAAVALVLLLRCAPGFAPRCPGFVPRWPGWPIARRPGPRTRARAAAEARAAESAARHLASLQLRCSAMR